MLKQYKEAIEKTNIIAKTDTKGIITFVNDEFCKISGYSRDELIGKNHNIVRHPDVPAATFKLLWDTIKKKKIYKSTVKNLAKDGSIFYVNTTVIPILDKQNNIVEFIAIRYDVTKEVLYKEELEIKEKELEELNKNLEKIVASKVKELKILNETLELRVNAEIEKNEEKQRVMFWQSRLASLGEMLANIAHQWRQPLTELNLSMFSLKKAALANELDNVVAIYNQSKDIVKNMSNTIEDFTNFFRPEKEKYLFNLSGSITEALHILNTLIEKDRINITTDLNQTIEILGVSNELSQVIINLIKNSADAFVQNSILVKEINICVRTNEKFAFVDILQNPDIRAELPHYANWPTFPQLWVEGELIGGCDIILEMFQKGELQPLIKETADKYREASEEA